MGVDVRAGWRAARGVLAGVLLVVLVVAADLLEGPGTAYIGVVTCAPFLAAVFAGPVGVGVVGAVALAGGQAYAAGAGAATSQAQAVRVAFILAATLLAAGAAAVRRRHEHALAEMTNVAEVAQATILRPVPPMAGSLGFASRYRSAASAARVGGDFYDVANTPHGVRLVVGDVRGKGLDAVRLASAVLGSFREAAFTAGPDLGTVARTVSDSVARQTGYEDFVTAVFVQLDVYGRGHVVNCGHPPPLRIGTDGLVLPVEPSNHASPLGLVTDPPVDELVLAPRERLLLYTDGLTEARGPDRGFFGLEAAAAHLATGGLDGALDALVERVRTHTGGRLSDDLALLLVEHHVLEVPRTDVLDLPRADDHEPPRGAAAAGTHGQPAVPQG